MADFWKWFDARKAQAFATELGAVMQGHGFDVTHTGGGCLAWELKITEAPEWAVWISDDDAGLGDDGPIDASVFWCSIIGPNGEDIAGLQETTISKCVDWAKQFTTGAALLSNEIVYCGDNEGPAVMPLWKLFSNFAESDGWQDRCNPGDALLELAGRGWYEGTHENGRYIILNPLRLKIMPHPELRD